MGTVNPGNSSGASMFKGSCAQKGPAMLRKESIPAIRLNVISFLLFNRFCNCQYKIAISRHPNKQALKIWVVETTCEKSAPRKLLYILA